MRREIPWWNSVSGVLRRERTRRRDCWTRANLPGGKVPFGPYLKRDYPASTVSVVCHSVTRRSKFSVSCPTYKGSLGAGGIAESRKYMDSRIDTSLRRVARPTREGWTLLLLVIALILDDGDGLGYLCANITRARRCFRSRVHSY